ncbi:MAG: UDP-3-O-(3-hydroxymyristoyl)glucosamine N-acyltransferase [Candidatus Melainabacteria bacterium HGW-Melainabacteria-1]|nr:MAG: UDP-3-O-(3-hydroxymyristoyl)glucosamine N-acyltransferase [Candidatus Melainabacteria bacterium HGW-Melainabacteria-1]
MQIKLSQLVATLGGTLEGDPDFVVTGLRAPEDAGPQDLVVLLEPGWLPTVLASAAQAVVIPVGTASVGLSDRQLLWVAQPRAALARLLSLFHVDPDRSHQISARAEVATDVLLSEPVEIGPFAVIETGVQIGANTLIGPHCVIGKGARIGRDCRLGPRVTLAPGTVLGDRVVIHAGTVIGSDGYGFYFHDGRHHKIPQVGIVVIEDDVEIGANVTIDRATLGQTLIGMGSKIDNLVQIGHNVRLGRHCLIVAQAGISGSTELGDHVTLAGQTGVAGHLRIGDGVVAAGKSGITKDLPAGLKVSGYPAQEHRLELRQQAALRRLPDLLRSLKKSPQVD